jgi:hypothetical protein
MAKIPNSDQSRNTNQRNTGGGIRCLKCEIIPFGPVKPGGEPHFKHKKWSSKSETEQSAVKIMHCAQSDKRKNGYEIYLFDTNGSMGEESETVYFVV